MFSFYSKPKHEEQWIKLVFTLQKVKKKEYESTNSSVFICIASITIQTVSKPQDPDHDPRANILTKAILFHPNQRKMAGKKLF